MEEKGKEEEKEEKFSAKDNAITCLVLCFIHVGWLVIIYIILAIAVYAYFLFFK